MPMATKPCIVFAALVAVPLAPAEPVVHWDFGTEEVSRLTPHGGVHRDQPGPRPPEFPDFGKDNTAVALDGNGARFVFDDPGDDSTFDFTNGDEITIEAWVNVKELGTDENRYIIGKGRTGDKRFAKDNQNWALRIREQNGQACLSFLFATEPGEGASPWHRWTTREGFAPGDGWHHVAATYRFGDPKSIAGWIDGRSQPGHWDMGGPTKKPPVVDNDAIWIGSALGGNAGNSFRGLVDEIAVHRDIVPDKDLSSRFRREGPPRVAKTRTPELGELPKGEVLVTLTEGIETRTRWPLAEAAETMRFTLPQFHLHRIPYRYDDWGIRESWKGPVLARMAADLELPPGEHTFLVRARGLSRLWINGKVVAKTKHHPGSTDGHNPVTPVANPPLPGLTPAPFGDQEVLAKVKVAEDGNCRVILEAMVGGKSLRVTTGTMLVALETEDSRSFAIVNPSTGRTHLTDGDLDNARKRAEALLTGVDDKTRRNAAASQDAHWRARHAKARAWASMHLPSDTANRIDGFLARKTEQALANSSGKAGVAAKAFHENVLPILSENCFRCHGEKEKGDLKLNNREAALDAIIPGKPEASELISRITANDEDERMPPKGDGLDAKQVAVLREWIQSGAAWPDPPVTKETVSVPPTIDDAAFLRRAFLDTLGVPPTEEEARHFLSERDPDKRTKLIDRLLADEGFADHWVSYWQDVLAENPSMLKPSLNNSGPFRWYLHEALRDNKPFDRMVTELIMMRGSEREGGTAGFGMAADNDAPFAAKAHVIGTAFLGIEMQCARCHDSPYHRTTQRDLYSIAAMLERKTVTVPKTSRVPAGFFEKKNREALIQVTLKSDEKIEPRWPFADEIAVSADPKIGDTRARLAAIITAPENERFAKVTVNRIWRRLIGAGFVEPPHDWENRTASHPELLTWLAHDFVAHGYDVKHLIRRIMTSEVYAREANGDNRKAVPAQRFFTAPERRRLTAEQVVDSLYAASGTEMNVEEITFDPDGRRPAKTMMSLGFPKRAWEFTSLSNERDRPSLSLPRAQAVCDVLTAFGWVAARQNSRTDRETDPDVLQPGILANSTVSTWITRASEGSTLAQLAVDAISPKDLVDSLFLRFLTRLPTNAERATASAALAVGFDERLTPASEVVPVKKPDRLPRIAWSNHLDSEANAINLKIEERARVGDPPDPRLRTKWREPYEDVVWSLINSPEFVWIP